MKCKMSEEPLERANEEEPDSSVSDLNPVKPEEAESTRSALRLGFCSTPHVQNQNLSLTLVPLLCPPGPAVRVHNATTTECFTDITMVTKQRGSTGNMAAVF